MTFKVMPEVQLRVDSAYPGDQGGGKARLDPETMLLLKISPGDLVVIEGKTQDGCQGLAIPCRGLEPAQDTD